MRICFVDTFALHVRLPSIAYSSLLLGAHVSCRDNNQCLWYKCVSIVVGLLRCCGNGKPLSPMVVSIFLGLLSTYLRIGDIANEMFAPFLYGRRRYFMFLLFCEWLCTSSLSITEFAVEVSICEIYSTFSRTLRILCVIQNIGSRSRKKTVYILRGKMIPSCSIPICARVNVSERRIITKHVPAPDVTIFFLNVCNTLQIVRLCAPMLCGVVNVIPNRRAINFLRLAIHQWFVRQFFYSCSEVRQKAKLIERQVELATFTVYISIYYSLAFYRNFSPFFSEHKRQIADEQLDAQFQIEYMYYFHIYLQRIPSEVRSVHNENYIWTDFWKITAYINMGDEAIELLRSFHKVIMNFQYLVFLFHLANIIVYFLSNSSNLKMKASAFIWRKLQLGYDSACEVL